MNTQNIPPIALAQVKMDSKVEMAGDVWTIAKRTPCAQGRLLFTLRAGCKQQVVCGNTRVRVLPPR